MDIRPANVKEMMLHFDKNKNGSLATKEFPKQF